MPTDRCSRPRRRPAPSIATRQEHPDTALARDLVPPKLINTTRPWNGVPPKTIDKRRHNCSIRPCSRLYWSAHPLDQEISANYAVLLPWWAEVVRGSGARLHIGEALYKAGDPAQPAPWQDPAELSRHLTLAKKHPEVRGHVFFAAKEVKADKSGAMARGAV